MALGRADGASVLIVQVAGGEAVAHGFLLPRVSACAFDEPVVQLVEQDKQGELVAVGEFNGVEWFGPGIAMRDRTGDVGGHRVGVFDVSAEVAEESAGFVVAGAGEVGSAAVADANSQVVDWVGTGCVEKLDEQFLPIEMGGIFEDHP